MYIRTQRALAVGVSACDKEVRNDVQLAIYKPSIISLEDFENFNYLSKAKIIGKLSSKVLSLISLDSSCCTNFSMEYFYNLRKQAKLLGNLKVGTVLKTESYIYM